jgi:hypothetical protein
MIHLWSKEFFKWHEIFIVIPDLFDVFHNVFNFFVKLGVLLSTLVAFFLHSSEAMLKGII